jgi:hypothetical protein
MTARRTLLLILPLLAIGAWASAAVAGWSEPVNMPGVNSYAYEDSPAITASGRTLYVNSTRAGGYGYFDIYVSTRRSLADTFSVPVNMGPTFNGDDFDATSYVSPAGDVLWVNSIREGGLGDRDIYTSRRVGGVWQPLVNVGEPISTIYEDSAPNLTCDGNTMIFASNRPGGLGGSDLYISHRTETGWTEPENLTEVNSSSDDRHPSILFDGTLLYFASKRPGGFGGFDLYSSRWMGDHFETPVNLGPPINTQYDDECPCFYFSGQKLIIVTDRPGGHGNLDFWESNWLSDVDVQLALDRPAVHRGDSLGYTLTLQNLTSTRQTFELWTQIYGDSLFETLSGPTNVLLRANQTLTQHFTQYMSPSYDRGYCVFIARIGDYPGYPTDMCNEVFRLR